MAITRYRTVFSGVAGTPWYNNLYTGGGSGSTDPDTTDIDAFWESIGTAMYNGISWVVEGTAAVIDETTGETTGSRTGANKTGSGDSATEPLPYVCQGLITLRTGVFVAGRELRGKVFVPGMLESGTTLGVFTAAVVLQMQTAADNLLSELAPGWLVYSPTHHVVAPVTSCTVSNKIAVLRSRRD